MFLAQHSMCEQVVVVLSLARYHSLGDVLLTGDMAPPHPSFLSLDPSFLSSPSSVGGYRPSKGPGLP